MGPTIFEKQNSSRCLRYLASQRQIYSNAKKLLTLQIILVVIVVTLLSVINYFCKIEWILGSYSAIITLIDIFLINKWIDNLKKRAAKIQEKFDTTLFELEWNDIISQVDEEVVFRYSELYKKKEPNFNSLKNWYSPKIKDIDSDLAKILCQRTNCVYDFTLRKYYLNTLIFLLAGLGLLVVILGLYQNISLPNFVNVLVLPLLPMISFGLQKYQDNQESIESLNNLKETTEEVWDKVIKGEKIDINKRSRSIQNRIYLNRKNNPLIFDWLYRIIRSRLEGEMHYSIEQMIKQIK